MEILEKSLNKLLTRDIFYIIGGVSIILAFLFYFDKFSFNNKIEYYTVILILLISYVIGYLTQEFLSLFRIVRTTLPKYVMSIDRILYKIFTGLECISPKEGKTKDTEKNNYQILDTDLQGVFLKGKDLEKLYYHKRIIDLKQIGSTIGSNWLICSIIIFLKYFQNKQADSQFILVLSISIFIFSVIAIIVNRIKLTQQIEFVYHNKELIKG